MAQYNHTDSLRIVLLGKTGVGKSETGNTILGRKAFGVKCSPESATQECAANDAMVKGQKITVIDTPGLYDTSMEIGKLKHQIEQLFNHSGEGIHAILLVIKVGRFTEEERNTVQWIKENFGEQASKNTIVLFTNGDELEHNKMEIKEYINEGEKLKKLIDQCNGRYHVFNNRNDDHTQVTELLVTIRNMLHKNHNSLYTKRKYEQTQKNLFIANIVGVITGAAVGTGVAGCIAKVVIGTKVATVGAAAAAGGAGAGAAAGGAAAAAGGAAAAGITKGVIAAAVVGGVGVAAVAGVFGLGAVIYKVYKLSNENKNKDS